MILEGERLPSVYIGTSPFCGAAQFGSRAYKYYERFCRKPENIVKLIKAAASSGIMGVQLIPYKAIVDAVQKVMREYPLVCATTVGLDDIESEIKIAKRVKSRVVFLHAQVTDASRVEEVKEFISMAKAEGLLPALATHKPSSSIPFFERADLGHILYLAPVNKAGYLMQDIKKTISAIERATRGVMAKKVLAAGKLNFKEALSFLKNVKGVVAVTIGIAETKDIESLLFAKKLFGG